MLTCYGDLLAAVHRHTVKFSHALEKWRSGLRRPHPVLCEREHGNRLASQVKVLDGGPLPRNWVEQPGLASYASVCNQEAGFRPIHSGDCICRAC